VELPRSRALVPELIVLASTPSTNSVLLTDRDAVDRTTVVTLDQTAGRGRLDRTWISRPGEALAVSVLVRDALVAPWASWVPLAAGAAMTSAIAALVPETTLKWPNDVLIGGAKVCGILVEAVPGTAHVVVGAGVNLRQTTATLPVPTATSLALAGVDPDDALDDELLARYLVGLAELLGGASVARIRIAVLQACTTVGRRVRIDPLVGEPFEGTATGIDEGGRLLVRRADGVEHPVSAADVTHATAR
jgi:BirA family biotin operon repressor/biotin-[acetyl-CoA-carboxylase] ligase